MTLTGPIRVLYIEDESTSSDGQVKTLLEQSGHPFVVFSESGVAASLARLEASRIDCIVTDTAAASSDGIAVVNAAQRSHPDVAVVFIDGRGWVAATDTASDRSDDARAVDGPDRIEALATRIRERVGRNRGGYRLAEFASVLSHDLGNVLHIARGRLDLARETGDITHLDDIDEVLTRAEALLDSMTTVMRQERFVTDVTAVDVGRMAREAWGTQENPDATLVVEDGIRVMADADALLRMLENLVRNAVEHGGELVAVRVGPLEGGFFVEDGGPGILESERERVFTPGYSTKEDGTGFGLVSIRQIADAHGWRVAITEGTDGGARFEFTGVEDANAAGATRGADPE